mmetsp:Transcript_5985/g.8307  ORF Transcript_5985/g.8307 Transcript_5985/m.8307 type:complete len:84 (+) Transcript_5985:860-1111(+)
MPLIRHVKFAALQTDCYDVHVAKQDGIVDKNTNELTGLGIEVSVSIPRTQLQRQNMLDLHGRLLKRLQRLQMRQEQKRQQRQH